MPYVASLTNVLSNHLGWHRARVKFIARFTTAVVKQATTDLWAIALALKADVQPASNHRRIQRFLSGYDLDQAALGRLLLHLLPTEPPYTLTLDRTEWHLGQTPVNVLAVGVVFGRVAVPIAWRALPKGGGSGAEDQIRLLEALLDVMDSASIDVLVADREFISVRWLRRLQDEGVSFAIRLRSDRQVARAPDGVPADGASRSRALPVRLFARPTGVGEQRTLESVRLFGEEGPLSVDLVIQRIGPPSADDPFVILAVGDVDPSRAMDLYRERWSIETLFAALKSRGLDMEETHVTVPARVERLIGLLALAFLWVRLIGERRTRREGPPRRNTHGRRQRSVFRYGLDQLRSILSTPKPQPAAFFDCLRLLRSPTLVLSCT